MINTKQFRLAIDKFLTSETAGNARVQICLSKVPSSCVKLYEGHKVLELAACGLKLEACCSTLEACRLKLESLGAK
jgi:hypothetical protein